MKIMLLTGEYPPQPGGIGDYTRRLGLALGGEHRVDVLTIQGGQLIVYTLPGDDQNCHLPDEQIVISPRRNLAWSPRCWPAVRAAVAERRPDWVHIQYQTGAYGMQVGVNLLPWRLRRQAQRPRVAVTFHDLLEPYLFPKAGPLRRWVNLRLARDADAVVTTNAADAAALARLLGDRFSVPHQAAGGGWQSGRGPATRHPPRQQATDLQNAVRAQRGQSLTTIPIGSNIPVAPPGGYERAAWRAAQGIAPEALLVAYFGLLSPSKGVDLLVAALAELPAEIPWRLLLIGGAATAPQDVRYAAEVRAQIARLGLADRVTITGQLTPAQVSAHLLAADLAALPFRDGASFRRGSLLAALAHGCPVVTTTPADADTAAQLRHDTEALLVSPGSTQALRQAIERLAYAPNLRNTIGARGRALAAQFSWPAIAAAHTLLYRHGS